MTVPKINSAHGSDTRNVINRAIEVLNHLGIDVQTLVAEGQLTEGQYARLITTINGLIKSGHVDKSDLTSEFKDEIEGFSAQLAQTATKDQVWNMPNMGQDIKEAMTGNSVAVVGKGAVLEENIVDNQVTPRKTNFLSAGKNIFDKRKVTLGGHPNPFTGGFTPQESYDANMHIPVFPNTTYTRKYNNHLVYHDVNKDFISGEINGGLTFTTPANCHFISVSTLSSNSLKDREQIELGATSTAYEEYRHLLVGSGSEKVVLEKGNVPRGFIEKDMMQDKVVDVSKVDFLKRLPNLIDKKAVSENTLLENTGFTVTSTMYDTSDYIKLLKDETVTFSNGLRKLILYSAQKTFESVEVNEDLSNSNYTFTAANDCFVRGSWLKQFTPTIVLNLGNTANENKSEYGYVLDEEKIKSPSNSTSDETNVSYDLKVIKQGETFFIESDFNEEQIISIEVERNGSLNGTFNFIATRLRNKVASSKPSGLLHGNTDDITPIRLSWNTVGANHGYVRIVSVKLTGHNKKKVDLGSIWTDGGTEYTLLKIKGDNLIFGCPYTIVNGIVESTTILPTANLTHVSGATNTSQVDVSNLNTGANLFPSVNNTSTKFILDGFEIDEDGEYHGKELQVQENYNIMSYKAIIDYAQSHIGQSYENDSIAGCVKMSINYTFTKGGKCLISHGLKALEKIRLGNCGFLQSVMITPFNGTSIYRYMPNVLPKGDVDFKNKVDMQNYSTNLTFGTSELIDPEIPPNRYVDLMVDSNNNNILGYSMGYVVDKANTKHTDRLTNSNVYWDMRSTKKSYPIALDKVTFETGEYMTFLGYRNYLDLYGKDATNINIVEDKKDTYVYVDYHKNVQGGNVNVNNHIGKNVSILESENFELLNDVVDAEGITFNITNNYGYAVLKVS